MRNNHVASESRANQLTQSLLSVGNIIFSVGATTGQKRRRKMSQISEEEVFSAIYWKVILTTVAKRKKATTPAIDKN